MLKLDAKDFSFEKLKSLPVDEQDSIFKRYVNANKAHRSNKEGLDETALVVGKALCVLEVRLNSMKQSGHASPSLALSDYFFQQYGAKPSNHDLTLKNSFGAFVLSNLITENDYDLNSKNKLEIAGRIVTEVKGNLTHDAVKAAAAQLIERGKDAAKNLRAILATVKPVEPLDADKVLELMEAVMTSPHFPAAISTIPDFVKTMPAENQQSAWAAMQQAITRIEETAGKDTTEAWLAAEARKTAPVQFTAGTVIPAEPVAA